jgi:hypothetical protein
MAKVDASARNLTQEDNEIPAISMFRCSNSASLNDFPALTPPRPLSDAAARPRKGTLSAPRLSKALTVTAPRVTRT